MRLRLHRPRSACEGSNHILSSPNIKELMKVKKLFEAF